MSRSSVHQGVIRGNSIELVAPPGLPDGQAVSVVITVRSPGQYEQFPPGEGLRTAFGAWADDQEGLDRHLIDMRRARDASIQTRRTE
jgi:hypothetical protein